MWTCLFVLVLKYCELVYLHWLCNIEKRSTVTIMLKEIVSGELYWCRRKLCWWVKLMLKENGYNELCLWWRKMISMDIWTMWLLMSFGLSLSECVLLRHTCIILFDILLYHFTRHLSFIDCKYSFDDLINWWIWCWWPILLVTYYWPTS